MRRRVVVMHMLNRQGNWGTERLRLRSSNAQGWFPNNIPSVSKTTQPASASLVSHHAPAHILTPWWDKTYLGSLHFHEQEIQAYRLSDNIQPCPAWKNEESGTCRVWWDPTTLFGTSSDEEELRSDDFKAFSRHWPTLAYLVNTSTNVISWIWKFSLFHYSIPFIFSIEVRLNHRLHMQWRLASF